MTQPNHNQDGLRESATFGRDVIYEIQRAARTGIYDIRGWGAKRQVPHFDDLVFLGASMSRYPLEGYRERCDTDVLLGTRYAKNPVHLDIPVTIAGMSFGSLSAQAKEALGRGASEVGTSTTTGDGGMTPEEREQSRILVYQLLPSRYGMNPRRPAEGGCYRGSTRPGSQSPAAVECCWVRRSATASAQMRTLPKDIDQRSACRHPDWTGPDDLAIKIVELREITDWQVPIYVKIGATRTYYDTLLAIKAGADVVVLDGMQGGTGATQDVFIEHVGIPTLPAVRQAVEALDELDMHRKVQLVVSGGIRSGCGCGQGPGNGGGRLFNWHGCTDCAGRQQPAFGSRVPQNWLGGRLLRRLAGRPRPGRHLDPDRHLGRASRPGGWRPPACQLFAGDDHGVPDHCPRLRQIARSQFRARGLGGADH